MLTAGLHGRVRSFTNLKASQHAFDYKRKKRNVEIRVCPRQASNGHTKSPKLSRKPTAKIYLKQHVGVLIPRGAVVPRPWTNETYNSPDVEDKSGYRKSRRYPNNQEERTAERMNLTRYAFGRDKFELGETQRTHAQGQTCLDILVPLNAVTPIVRK